MPHDPEWPDKAMFAAYLLIMGGTLGLMIEGLRSVATVENNLPEGILASYPTWLSVVMSGVTLLLGIVCLRTQAAVFGYAGAVAGMFSLAYAGLVPFLSLLAVFFLVKSHLEGEETRNDGIKLHTSLWPDKAMAAALFIVTGGSVAGFQGIAIIMGHYEPIVLDDLAWLAIAADLATFIFCFYAARQVYHLRKPWLGTAAAIVCMLTLALYVLGPLLGIIILVYMGLARTEGEFRAAAVGAPQATGAPRPTAPK